LSLQFQHAAAQNTICARIQRDCAGITRHFVPIAITIPWRIHISHPHLRLTSTSKSDSLAQLLGEWRKSINGQWCFIHEEWGSEQLATRRRRTSSSRARGGRILGVGILSIVGESKCSTTSTRRRPCTLSDDSGDADVDADLRKYSTDSDPGLPSS
jgi:hypothetical protein